MKQIICAIAGTTPLICNRFTDERQMAASNGTSISTVGDRGTPFEQAQKKLYIGVDGKTLIIPQPNLFRCFIDAGKFFKAGKSKVTTMKNSLIPACLTLTGVNNSVEIEIKHKENWTVDTRPVRNPATGGRILTHRPLFNDWELLFNLELDETIIGISLLREIVDAAGSRIGLGDYRPDCKGPYGKFKVIKWQAE